MIECTLCLPCWKKTNPQKPRQIRSNPGSNNPTTVETGAIMIGAMEEKPTLKSKVSENITSPYSNATGSNRALIDHFIFHSEKGWKEAE